MKTKYLILNLIIVVLVFGSIIIIMDYDFQRLSKRIDNVEKTFNAPVVVTPSLDVSDEHTQDIVKQAYQYLCENVEGKDIFDFGYELSFGGNDSNQMLIYVTFYYTFPNSKPTRTCKLVNYYENPQEWEIVNYELFEN